jgi:hypothetical protein
MRLFTPLYVPSDVRKRSTTCDILLEGETRLHAAARRPRPSQSLPAATAAATRTCARRRPLSMHPRRQNMEVRLLNLYPLPLKTLRFNNLLHMALVLRPLCPQTLLILCFNQ